MNPLLFADWGRMNRLFTKLMWTAAAIMACVLLAVLVSAQRPPHAATARPASAPAMHAAGAPGVAAGAAAFERNASR